MSKESTEFFKKLDVAKAAIKRANELGTILGFDYPVKPELEEAALLIETAREKAGFGWSEED
jgi:hypothetical protein